MKDQVDHFKSLHKGNELLLIGNVWDAASARVFEKLNFKAIATSSSAVAETLGYKDGEEMTFDEYLFIIKRIRSSTKLPFSVDLETGYGKTPGEIVLRLKALSEVGVVGVNIEDTVIEKGSRKLGEAKWFADRIKQVIDGMAAKNILMFINVRCDAFLMGLPDARKEAIARIGLYEPSGIDGIFLPCITDLTDIQAAVKSTQLPVHVMAMPGLPDLKALQSAGVKRVSLGGFQYRKTYGDMERTTQAFLDAGNLSVLFT